MNKSGYKGKRSIERINDQQISNFLDVDIEDENDLSKLENSHNGSHKVIDILNIKSWNGQLKNSKKNNLVDVHSVQTKGTGSYFKDSESTYFTADPGSLGNVDGKI